MSLFSSLKSIAKNLGIAAGTTLASAGRKAINTVQTQYKVLTDTPQIHIQHTKPAPAVPVTKAPTVTTPTVKPAKAKIDYTTIKGVGYAARQQETEIDKLRSELDKAKADIKQYQDWIYTKKQQEEAARAERENIETEFRNKYQRYGFDDESRLNLNMAGLTVDADSGRIVDSNGRLIMQNLGYTPEEIFRFFREHPELADVDDSTSLRRAIDEFFGGQAWDAVSYVSSSGSF